MICNLQSCRRISRTSSNSIPLLLCLHVSLMNEHMCVIYLNLTSCLQIKQICNKHVQTMFVITMVQTIIRVCTLVMTTLMFIIIITMIIITTIQVSAVMPPMLLQIKVRRHCFLFNRICCFFLHLITGDAFRMY